MVTKEIAIRKKYPKGEVILKLPLETEGVEINPDVVCGNPVLKGTRMQVALILDMMAEGMNFNEIKRRYPHITKEDIRKALKFAARICENIHVRKTRGQD